MNKIVGFARISNSATSCKGAKDPSQFIGKVLRVLEFGPHGDVLVINPDSTALAMFDKQDVHSSFTCGYSSPVITPPGIGEIEQMMYAQRAMLRKGGYDQVVAGMVIQLSLLKGKFTDSFLWAMQDEDPYKDIYESMGKKFWDLVEQK